MNVEQISQANRPNYSNLIRRSLMKDPKIASAVESGQDKIEESLKRLSIINKPLPLSDNFQTPELSLYSAYNLIELKQSNPEKFNLIISVLNNMLYCNTQQRITPKTIDAFINELINLKDTTTLKRALESGVKIVIIISDSVASYSNATKQIILCQNKNGGNNIDSLPHELGHAFDQNTPIDLNSKLHRGLIPKLKKNKDGSYKVIGLLPNAKRKTPLSWLCPKTVAGKDIISDYASTSEEFNEALQKDFKALVEQDKKNGLKQGTIFRHMMADWNEDSLFAYYLGVRGIGSTKIQKYLLQREMFAQMASLSTAGCTTRPNFDIVVYQLFPNTFKFVDDLIKGRI